MNATMVGAAVCPGEGFVPRLMIAEGYKHPDLLLSAIRAEGIPPETAS